MRRCGTELAVAGRVAQVVDDLGQFFDGLVEPGNFAERDRARRRPAPPAAEAAEVRVAGQNVRADAGKVSGTAAILVPLIKTKPGDLSYDVELVYRSGRGARLVGEARAR